MIVIKKSYFEILWSSNSLGPFYLNEVAIQIIIIDTSIVLGPTNLALVLIKLFI